MELEDRVFELEKLYNALDHGRFERIEKGVSDIQEKMSGVIRLDTEVDTLNGKCVEYEKKLDWLKEKRDQDIGATGLLRYVIPASIALTGILVGLITWGLDKIVH